MIGVTNELPEHYEKYELHRLIGVLLSDRLRENEKLDIIEKEYKIPLSNDFRKEMDTMYNFSLKTVAVADDTRHLTQVCIYLSVPVLFIFLSSFSATDTIDTILR